MKINRFAISLAVILLVFFGLHIWVLQELDKIFTISKIGICYTINFIIALAIFKLFSIFINKKSELLGFIFLIGSLFKFIIYFAILRPIIQNNGSLTKIEFSFFFLPYAICLILEIFYLVKAINSQQPN